MEKRTVLLVDDSAIIARQLRKILEESGQFEVVGEARNGMEGLKLYNTLKPDIVLMDIVMPEYDGLQAIRAIKAVDKDATIVVVSSTGGVGDQVAEALTFGAKNFITKPFKSESVIGTLNGV